jgi:hypothetical protein
LRKELAAYLVVCQVVLAEVSAMLEHVAGTETDWPNMTVRSGVFKSVAKA